MTCPVCRVYDVVPRGADVLIRPGERPRAEQIDWSRVSV